MHHHIHALNIYFQKNGHPIKILIFIVIQLWQYVDSRPLFFWEPTLINVQLTQSCESIDR